MNKKNLLHLIKKQISSLAPIVVSRSGMMIRHVCIAKLNSKLPVGDYTIISSDIPYDIFSNFDGEGAKKEEKA